MSTPTAVILAAGLGTRMKSPLAKVLHPLAGRPMVGWVVRAMRDAGVSRVILVIHHQGEQVQEAVTDVEFARQEVPRGTGDALAAALPLLDDGPVVVSAGDTPLLSAATVRRLLHEAEGPATVASFRASDPTGYGRIVRDPLRIVEDVDCTPEERALDEVNSGLYVFDAAWLRARVPSLVPHPPKGEFYLTDLIGPEARVVRDLPAEDFAGINDRAQLAEARMVVRRRINRALARIGVDFADLDTIHIDAEAMVHPGAQLGLGTVIEGRSEIAGEVGPHAVLRNVRLSAGARVLAGSVLEGATVQTGAVVGPLARLRPGAVIEEEAHIGNFVEVKNTVVRRGAKANHLSYLGDADIGEGANIGAGTITCNYDGVRKHRTVVGPGAFIGSNTALVAPIVVGAGAIVGAGSTLTEEVPPQAIAVERAPVRVRPGGAERLRARYRALTSTKP